MGRVVCVALALLLVGSVYAELQNVEVGGEIRIRGRYWRNAWAGGAVARMPLQSVGRRPVGAFGLNSLYDWDDRGNDLSFVEQRTAVNVKATFSDNVSAFIELDDYEQWGQNDFRSINYVTGIDTPANSVDDVEVFEAYIDADELFGQPLRLRIGRQKLTMGKAWLIGSAISPTRQVSYDGIRLTYDVDDFTVDGWWMKLNETSPAEEDSDVDYYGIYGTYKGLDALSLSAYWVLVRDARQVWDTPYNLVGSWVEDVLDLDDYDVTNLHTVGLRAWGKSGPLDYDLELAYQFGEAGQVGATFQQRSIFGTYGDDGADFDSWAADLQVGYTFDCAWQPRVYIGGAYFEGEDERDFDFWEWLNPFDKADASVSFNRLFSGVWYSACLDIIGAASALTNFHQIRAGVTAKPTDEISTGLSVAYFGVNEPFDWPRYITLPAVGSFPDIRLPIIPQLSFWTEESDDDIGWVTHVFLKYQYSEDWWIKIGWEHLFTGDGLEDGSFINRQGLQLNGGTDDDDADYIYFDTQIKF